MLKGIQHQKEIMDAKDKAHEVLILFSGMKNCALIAVGLLVDALKKIFGDQEGIVLSDIVYWEDVLEEIKLSP